MGTVKLAWLTVASLLIAATWTVPAMAQPADSAEEPAAEAPEADPAPEPTPTPRRTEVSIVTQRARSLFERAVVLLREGRAAEGRDLLRESLAILPTVATRYNLAVALRRTGEVTEARFLLRRLREEGLDENQRARIDEQLQLIAAQVATLEISVEGAQERAEIEVDGISVGEAGNHTPFRIDVDPGEHSVAALEENLRGVGTVNAPRGETARVRLQLEPFTEAGGDDAWAWALAIGAVLAAGAAVGLTLYFTIGQDEAMADPYPNARNYETLLEARF